jgi:hypothetical protein
MSESKAKEFGLDKGDSVICHLSEDSKRLLLEFHVDKRGLTKTGVNGLIDALKNIRRKMER